jgi:hypothetical protein
LKKLDADLKQKSDLLRGYLIWKKPRKLAQLKVLSLLSSSYWTNMNLGLLVKMREYSESEK